MTSDPTDRPTVDAQSTDGPSPDEPAGNPAGDPEGNPAGDALTARLARIDALPLAERAAAFTALHAELTQQMSPPTTKDTPND